MDDETPIIIAGGGIGGLTTAIALQRHDIPTLVLERAPKVRASGSGITIQTNAMIVMEELGIADDLRREGAVLSGGTVRNIDGKVLQQLDLDIEPSGVAIHRERLLRLLAEHNPAPIRFDAHVVDFHQREDGVDVELADGTRLESRALVGCDGLYSDTRKAMRGEDPLVYAGYTTWRGVCKADVGEKVGRESTEIWGAGERFGIVPIGHGETYWFAVAATEAGGNLEPDPTDRLLQRYAGWPDPVETLLRSTRDEDVLRTDTFDRDPIDSWTDGRVCLLGDAAHPMTPNLGQGAGQAIEDALALANAVAARPDDLVQAFVDYEQCRIERANWFVKQSRRMGQLGQMSNPVARAMRNLGLRLTPTGMTRRSVARMYDPVVEPVGP